MRAQINAKAPMGVQLPEAERNGELFAKFELIALDFDLSSGETALEGLTSAQLAVRRFPGFSRHLRLTSVLLQAVRFRPNATPDLILAAEDVRRSLFLCWAPAADLFHASSSDLLRPSRARLRRRSVAPLSRFARNARRCTRCFACDRNRCACAAGCASGSTRSPSRSVYADLCRARSSNCASGSSRRPASHCDSASCSRARATAFDFRRTDSSTRVASSLRLAHCFDSCRTCRASPVAAAQPVTDTPTKPKSKLPPTVHRSAHAQPPAPVDVQPTQENEAVDREKETKKEHAIERELTPGTKQREKEREEYKRSKNVNGRGDESGRRESLRERSRSRSRQRARPTSRDRAADERERERERHRARDREGEAHGTGIRTGTGREAGRRGRLALARRCAHPVANGRAHDRRRGRLAANALVRGLATEGLARARIRTRRHRSARDRPVRRGATSRFVHRSAGASKTRFRVMGAHPFRHRRGRVSQDGL